MRRSLGVLLLLSLALFAAAETAADKDEATARRSQQKALELYLKGDFDGALSEAGEALRRAQHSLPALALRARLWYAAGNRAETLRDARRVISEFPKSGKTSSDHVAHGSALLLTGDNLAAMAAFDAALQLEGGSFEALAGKARAWRAMGEHQKELDGLNEVIEQAISVPLLYRYNRAHAYLDLGRTQDATRELAAVLRSNPKFPLAYGLLGLALAKKGDQPRALKAYSRALALNPRFAFAYLGRGAIHLARGEKDAAIKDFDEAVSLNPSEWSGYFNRGEAWWRRGNKEEALADYRKALNAELPDAASAMTVGDRFLFLLLWPEAIEAFAKARELGAGAAAWIRTAQAREGNRQPEEAREALDKAIEKEPSSAPALLARGMLHARLGDEGKALADFNAAYRFDPKNLDILVARGSFLARTGKPNAALEDFNAAIALAPKTSAESYNNRGALYANAFGELDAALKDVLAAVELNPKDAGYQFNLGAIYLKRRQFHKALESFDRSLGLRGPAARILQYRAEAHAQLGWRSKAMRDIQSALEKDPKNPALHATLGQFRLRSREFDLALQDLDIAAKLDGKNASALAQRGLAHAHLGEFKRALADLNRAVELDEKSKETWTSLCHARRMAKDPEGAVKACTRALAADESHAPAYLHRGLSYFRMGEPFKAIDDIDRAARLGLKRPEGFLAQSVSHRAAQQYRQAHMAYLEAMSLDPEAHTPEINFGGSAGDRDDYYNAVSELDEAGDADASDPYLYIVRGDAQRNVGRLEHAVREYTKAMEIDGTIADAYRARGDALAAQDAFEPAQQDLLRAVELDPKDASSHVRLAALFLVQGRYPQAVKSAERALELDPNTAEAHLRAGNAQYFLKKHKKALEHYQAASRLDPANPNAFNGIGLGHFALRQFPEALESFTRAIALYPNADRYFRNRGSTFTNMGEFANAAADFKMASLVNTDPASIDEYNVLVTEAQAKAQASAKAAPDASDTETP